MFVAFVGIVALAGSSLSVPTPEPVPVIGGSVAQTCQWPATVRLGGCSGTLVHPEIVVYAAHCGSPNSVRFGVTGNDRTVATQYCAAAPEYPEVGYDYAYCRLAQPVDDVPFVPILMGCEHDELEIGRYVSLVGFGVTSNGGSGFGTKRWIEGTIAGFPADGRLIGIFYDDPSTGVCNGDSGGSAYIQLEDGSWRLFAITSTVPGSCGGSSQHVPASAAVAWIERHAGIDISPCHDADGTWNPSPGCTGFPLAPNDGDGLSWQTGCGPGPVSGPSQTCGPADGEPPDVEAPTIVIVTPTSGAVDGPLHTASIEVAAEDDWGVRDVTISIDGVDQATLETPPFVLPVVDFPNGTWEIGARARDWSGNVGDAEPVILQVGSAGGTDGGETGDTSGTGGDDSTSDAPPTSDTLDPDTTGDPQTETDADLSQTAGDDGCSCRATPRSATPWLAVMLLLASSRRRPSTRR